MTPSPPSSDPTSRQTLLDTLLAAHKAGRLDEVLAQHPRATRALGRRWLKTVQATAGDALPAAHRESLAVTLLLRWALAQMRPDQAPTLDAIDRAAWLERTSWRPLLALLCHHGFEPVPAFRDRYHARADEAAADALCGLWAVGPSTFYRYLDKGKRLLTEVLAVPPAGPRATALRRLVQLEVDTRLAFADDGQRRAWHRRQADTLAASDPASVLWHHLAAGDAAAFVQGLRRAHVALANDAESDTLCDLLVAQVKLSPREAFDLHLARATLWRMRHATKRESQAYDQALQIAAQENDALMLGIVYGALGKFHEPRDADRAFACYEESAEQLSRAASQTQGREATEEHAATLTKLAWLYVLRNDPRSRTILDRAQQLHSEHEAPPQLHATLEQTWGEYWRRAGELPRAIQHKHRALNLYERIGDRRSVLVTYSNLALLYGQVKEFERAIDYAQRVIGAGQQQTLEPEMLCSAHMNLGAIHYWRGCYPESIEQYSLALERARGAGLPLHTRRAHYNLADAYYMRFKATRDGNDERLGDAHAAAAVSLAEREGDMARVEDTRKLKSVVLGEGAETTDRLLPQEFAAHFEQMTEVQRQRAILAIPIEAAAHVRAHLAIANAYLAIAAKERESALALIHKHQLGEQFAAEFEALRSTYNRELTREEQLAALWRERAADLLGDERRAAALAELFRAGAINKSAYAQVCGVALATASKHLTTLAERSLLVQTGKGPSTRYVLPSA
jgi:tetratricopeptide (TPR) repeat protein